MLPRWLNQVIEVSCNFLHPQSCLISKSRICIDDRRKPSKKRNAALRKPLSPNRKQISLSYNPGFNAGSPLLNSLPLEIRHQIYLYALGSRYVHVVKARDRLAYISCKLSTHTDFMREYWPWAIACEFVAQKSPTSPVRISIALLHTCRQIYAEALPTLYSTNVFDINDLSAFNYLASQIPAMGLSAVRILHLHWFASTPPLQSQHTKAATRASLDDETYLRLWRTVSGQMPSLRELRLAIADALRVRKLNINDPWVQPIKEIKGLRVFELKILRVNLDPYQRTIEEDGLDEFAAALRREICSKGN